MAEIIHEKQDLTYLSWSKIHHSSGPAGSFLKAYSDLDGQKTYYKLSNYDAFRGVIGHECVNELIVDRLLDILGVEHLHYQLIHAEVCIDSRVHDTWVCASKDFKHKGESKLALDAYYQAERDRNESPLDFCIRCGWGRYIFEMLAVDYLILNRDRHGANIEVLRDVNARTIRLAPLFDHGLSLMFNCHDDKSIDSFDVMKDGPVQSFVGSRSTWENLKLIAVPPAFHPLQEDHRDVLLEGLEDVLPRRWLDKIWEMLWKRWCVYEGFCDSRGWPR